MGDSETVVAQKSAGYSSTDNGDTDTCLIVAPDDRAVSDGVGGELASAATASGDLAASAVVDDATNTIPDSTNAGGGLYSSDLDTAMQGTSGTEHYDSEPSYGVADSSGNREGPANTSVDSMQVASYDSSANGNEVNISRDIVLPGISENGDPTDDVHGSASEHQLGDDSALSAEEERLWSIVRANSFDFNSWTALIEETEKVAEGNISRIRKVYDAFLAEFPLCYGYWKKYADHEARLGAIDKVVEVYERAVQGVTYSVDIWLHYCLFCMSTYGDPDVVRRMFERALAYVGTDYQSFPLWDKYIEYEYMQQEWSRLASIYTQILDHPNQQLDRYYTSFKELAGSRPLSELWTAEEAVAAANATIATADSEPGAEEIDGEVHPNGVEQSLKPVSSGLTEAEELEKYIAVREEMYKKAKDFDSKIIGFETAIRRPYFHVRPLNVSELENWHNYLNFIEGGDDFNKKHLLKRDIELRPKHGPFIWFRYG